MAALPSSAVESEVLVHSSQSKPGLTWVFFRAYYSGDFCGLFWFLFCTFFAGWFFRAMVAFIVFS